MVAAAGRDLRIKYDDGTGAAVIAGARTDTLTINNEMIDVTSKDDIGVRTLLNDVGLKSMSLSCEGVLKNDTLQGLARDAAANAAVHDFEIQVAALGSYSGKFFIASFEATGATGGEMTFTCSLESADAITFT